MTRRSRQGNAPSSSGRLDHGGLKHRVDPGDRHDDPLADPDARQLAGGDRHVGQTPTDAETSSALIDGDRLRWR